jgi:predicted permease
MNSPRPKIRAFWRRLIGTFRRDRAVHDFDAELEAHVAMDTEAGIKAGLDAREARRQALVRLGGAEQARQAHRERRGYLWLEQLIQDIRYGFRTLRRAPGFTFTAILTVGLGIGACTAIFSLVNAVLIRSLPYGDPERLVYLFTPNPNLKIPAEVICPAYGDYYDIRRESRSFESMSNFVQVMLNLDERGTLRQIGSARVDEDFFKTLQSQPDIGRAISNEDVQEGRDKVAVISHSLWISLFGGRADVLQQSMVLDKASYRIIGVMPSEVEYPFGSDLPYGNSHIHFTQIWVPLVLSAKERSAREPDDNTSIARLRPGVTIREAQAEMAGIMARLNKQYPGDPKSEMGAMRQWGALIERFTDISIGPVRPLMRLLLAAVGVVLLIACGNAADLLLARSTERSRELGVRAALGAERGRMARQLLTESLLIGFGGCVVGVVLAYLFLRLLPRLDPGNIPRLNEASLDARVLLVAIGASLLTSLIAGLLPAVSASRKELTEFLKSQSIRGSAGGHSRMQGALIVAQTAMVVVLLSAAGLLIRSYINVETVDTGFSKSTVTFHLSLDGGRYKPQQMGDFYRSLMLKLETLPGVQAAGAVNDLPLSNSESIGMIWVDGYPNKDFQQTEGRVVTPDYFAAMNIPLIAGRFFNGSDTAGRRSVIINQTFAKTYFPNRNPIGGRISGDPKVKITDWSSVVGVVADIRHISLEEEPQPQMYSSGFDGEDASIAVRATIPPPAVVNEIRTTLRTVDPSLALTDICTMGDWVSIATARRRFQTSLLAAFAAIALLLALVGLYGLMAFSVNRRTREVGIRMALGAERRDVLFLILRNASVLIASGLFAGLVCTWIVTRVLESFLFGVSQHDPLTVISVSLLLVVCGLIAAIVPARRAASIDPMQALRTE